MRQFLWWNPRSLVTDVGNYTNRQDGGMSTADQYLRPDRRIIVEPRQASHRLTVLLSLREMGLKRTVKVFSSLEAMMIVLLLKRDSV